MRCVSTSWKTIEYIQGSKHKCSSSTHNPFPVIQRQRFNKIVTITLHVKPKNAQQKENALLRS